MDTSKKIGGLLGPAMVVSTVAELHFIQPNLYADQTPSGVFTAGGLLFIAGLAMLRAHNIWVLDWRVLITLTAWLCFILGMVRLFTATSYQQTTQEAVPDAFILSTQIVLIVIGAIITAKSYLGERGK